MLSNQKNNPKEPAYEHPRWVGAVLLASCFVPVVAGSWALLQTRSFIDAIGWAGVSFGVMVILDVSLSMMVYLHHQKNTKGGS